MLNNKINRIWVALLVATLITFGLGESGLAGRAGIVPVLVMFALAYGKGILVILDFMELRHAPVLWRRLMVGWLTVVVTAILLAYWVGTALA
ncbi:MAG: cytochrome C oxidase subunit IV family protein [Burkholderiales bacterium]|nr:cytochrome C oxidase subunit IV family protein [Burkholderiales bacterium]